MIIKKYISFFCNEFFYGGHIVSLGIVSVSWAVFKLLYIPMNFYGFFSVYFLSQSIYEKDRYTDYKNDISDNPERSKHISHYLSVMPYLSSMFFLFSLIIALYKGSLYSIILVVIIWGLGIHYPSFFKPLSRKFIGFKNLFVSLIWSLSVLFVLSFRPINYISIELNVLLIYVFLRMFELQIIFDFKDLHSDIKAQIKTIPVLFGRKISMIFLHLLNVASLLLVLMSGVTKINTHMIFVFLFFFLYSETILLFGSVSKNKVAMILFGIENLFWAPITYILLRLYL